MSVSEKAKFDHILVSRGVPRDDESDDSVLEFLFEALKSKDLAIEEKIEWICMSVPALYTLRRDEVVDVIRDFCTVQKSSSNYPATKATNGDRKPAAEKPAHTKPSPETSTSALTQRVVDDIKYALLSRQLEGSDIVEEELVEYLLTFVDELEIYSDCESNSKLDELNSVLMSFFTEIEDCPDALSSISNILCEAHAQRRKASVSSEESSGASSPSPPRRPIAPSSSFGNRIDKVVKVQEDSPQMRDDISALMLMVPQAPEEVIRHVYSVLCGSNRVGTAQYLLERGDTEGIQKMIQSKYQFDKKEAESSNLSAAQSKKIKAAVCSKYGELLVKATVNEKGKADKTKTALPIQFIDIESKDKKIRYRDDHVVTHSGAKTITLHNPADDYDGGSHGTVKSKGKRGPGSSKC